MFIVHSIGSDEENPFKIFTSGSDAIDDAKIRAMGSVERVCVYEWTGRLQEGLIAAREGRLKPIMHFAHTEEPHAQPPEPPIRLSTKAQDKVMELVKKMPMIARKF